MLIESEDSKGTFCKYKVSSSGPDIKCLTSGGFCRLNKVIQSQKVGEKGGIMGVGNRASVSGFLAKFSYLLGPKNLILGC